MNVFLLSQQAFQNALFAEDMTFLATERIDERLQAEAASIEGLNRVLPKSLLLGSIPELSFLLIGEEGKVVVVLRMPLRHLLGFDLLGDKSSIRVESRYRIRFDLKTRVFSRRNKISWPNRSKDN